MIYRKFSFSLFLFVSMLTTIYLLKIFPNMNFIAMAFVSAAASASLKISSSLKLKKTGLLLLAVSAGLILGTALNKRIEFSRKSAYVGVKTENISDLTGYLVKDSISTSEGGNIYIINIISVHSQIKDTDCSARGTVKIFTAYGKKLYAGQIIKLGAKLIPAPPDSDVHFTAQSTGIKITEQGFYYPMAEIRSSVRILLETNIKKMGYPASALFEAVFLGMTENLPADIYNGFQETGTLHILALSGLHAGIIYFLVTILLYFLPGRLAKFVSGSFFIFLYLFIAGPKASLVRATIMLFIFGACYFLRREKEPLNILSISGCIILVIDPSWAFNLSFQLSFLALLGIIITGRPITRFFRPYMPGFICYPLACSIGAQIATAPVVLINFGKLYPVGILVTLILVPLITLFIWTGIIFLFISNLQVCFINLVARQFLMFTTKIIDSIVSFFKAAPAVNLDWKMWHWCFFLFFLIPLFLNLKYIIKIIIPAGNTKK